MADSDARLADFLANPRETPEVELKQWLDLGKPENRGKVARHLMALANYGGGWLQFGFVQQPDGLFTHEGIGCPDPKRYPGNDPRKGGTYDRLPGPESSPLSEANDWHELLERCLRARRDELVASIQTAIGLLGYGGLSKALEIEPGAEQQPGELAPRQSATEVLEAWVAEAEARLAQRLSEPQENSNLYADGSWSFAYSVQPPPTPPASLSKLREVLLDVVGRETGWPAWWWPTIEDGRGPQPVGDVIECWMRGGTFSDAAHADFWRASGLGQLYLLRGYDEDSAAERSPAHSHLKPGVILDPVIAVWRVGECLLHAERMARRLGAEAVCIDIRWSGLMGRQIGTLEPLRRFYSSGPSQQENAHSQMTVKAEVISGALAELVRKATEPLFVQFDFFEMRMEEIERELDRMRGLSAE
jgi:hypothetical protein